MAKKESEFSKEAASNLPLEKEEVREIGVILSHFCEASAVSPQYWHKSVKSWKKDQVIRDKAELEHLISLNAPMEVFFQHVNGRSKN